MNLAQIGEFGLIERLQSQLQKRAGTQLGIGDDCAVLESLQTPIVTMDALIEGVHFRRDWTSPRALGRKAMAVNLSDLASSGARPVAAFVSLALGPRDDFEFITELYAGFEDAAREHHFTVAGGDTTKSRGDLMISIALVGEVLNHKRGPVLRSGAQAGDVLLVSGNLGDAAAGFQILQAEKDEIAAIPAPARDYLLLRHHQPSPRLALMKQLLEFDASAIHAALDLSDGLVGDAAHLAQSSDLVAQFDAEKVPISFFCRQCCEILGCNVLDLALSGGEDYEILLAVAPQKAQILVEEFRGKSVFLSAIGVCLTPDLSGNQARVAVRENGEVRQVGRAWTHF
ncbi:thiamine-phosphate kinase [Abditibacterium utsteinense]|uniref:Thiamine-monophosphate kinase n=1 Tax=Abditibacterium utsteinense TaxID=1960156 RepID=A0A2S8ST58_9BACT|nr:thiamine-phosphate kinase [Abditibacterium utsteinense]PQV63994.1 thiamine-phosphate kinase [Abditibacterium utsteinense]